MLGLSEKVGGRAIDKPLARPTDTRRLEPSSLLTLREAWEFFFKAEMTLGEFRKVYESGALPYEKLGGRVFTTPKYLARWKGWGPKHLEKMMPGDVPRRVVGSCSMIYVIASGDCVKIGITTNVDKRLKAIATHCAHKPRIVALFEGTPHDERTLHKRFAAHRLNGEWFKAEGAVSDWIEEGCPHD